MGPGLRDRGERREAGVGRRGCRSWQVVEVRRRRGGGGGGVAAAAVVRGLERQ